MSKRRRRARRTSAGRLTPLRRRLAAEERLRFPEPFFWTTDYLERLRERDPDYRSRLIFGTIDVLAAPKTEIRVVAEGDSWFHHPCIDDVMDWFKRFGYAPYRSDAPGRTLVQMVSEKVYLKFLGDPDVKAVLLSGGGNDLISWRKGDSGHSPIFKPANDPSRADDWVDEAELVSALAEIERLLGIVIGDVRAARPRMPIITHCYDRIHPRRSGPFGAWVGPQLDDLGVPQQQRLRNEIAAILIDRANETYQRVSVAQRITYVDVRGIVGNRWWDEIHPESDAFGDIAKQLAAQVPAGRSRRR